MLYRWKRSCAISSTQLTKWKWSFFMMSEENECSFHDDFLVFTRGKCVFFIEISKWNESSYIKKKLCIFKKKEIKMWEFKILNGWEWEGLGTTKRREGQWAGDRQLPVFIFLLMENVSNVGGNACERGNPMEMKGCHVLTVEWMFQTSLLNFVNKKNIIREQNQKWQAKLLEKN